MADEKPKKNDAHAKLEERVQSELEQGFLGVEVDPTPNERYSLESDDFRTPETDPDAYAEAQKALGGSRFGDASSEGDKP